MDLSEFKVRFVERFRSNLMKYFVSFLLRSYSEKDISVYVKVFRVKKNNNNRYVHTREDKCMREKE